MTTEVEDFAGGARLKRSTERTVRETEAPVARKSLRERPGSQSVFQDKQAVPKAIKDAYPDCQFYWENDSDNSRFITAREERGWEVVRGTMSDGKWLPGNKDVGLGSVFQSPCGGGGYQVLMVLPNEWYKDDVRQQTEAVMEKRNALRRGSRSGEVMPDGSYAASNGAGGFGFTEKFSAR